MTPIIQSARVLVHLKHRAPADPASISLLVAISAVGAELFLWVRRVRSEVAGYANRILPRDPVHRFRPAGRGQVALVPEMTEDGRYIVVNGRRWRATDPDLPDDLRQELVDQLMEGRRRVGTAKRAGDERALRRARRAVHDAKVALGERGEPWWDPTGIGIDERRAAASRALRRHRRCLRAPNVADIGRDTAEVSTRR